MHCLISVAIRQWSAVHAEALAAKQSLGELPPGAALPRPPVLEAASGFLLVVDWDGERVLGIFELPKPTGFLLERERLHVALWQDDQIVSFAGQHPMARYQHRWFNHIHTLDRTARGLLVCSSGTDLIAEIDEQGQLIWECFLFEHGYGSERYRFGQRFDRAGDYNGRYVPAAATAHPNSAILVDDHVVLATLFTPGQLVRIDRRSGQVDVILDGLQHPHSIRRRAAGGYMLCDTEGGAVLLLDRALRLEARIAVSAPWIQDAVLHGERLLVVANRRIITRTLPAPEQASAGRDVLDNYVLEVGDGVPRKKLCLGGDNRIYMVEPITAAAAEGLAHAWRSRPFDMPWLRWDLRPATAESPTATHDRPRGSGC